MFFSQEWVHDPEQWPPPLPLKPLKQQQKQIGNGRMQEPDIVPIQFLTNCKQGMWVNCDYNICLKYVPETSKGSMQEPDIVPMQWLIQ